MKVSVTVYDVGFLRSLAIAPIYEERHTQQQASMQSGPDRRALKNADLVAALRERPEES